jgi:Ca-activated chloride channel family protein
MTLLTPAWLWLLVPVALLALAYLLQQRRRSSYAVTFAALPLLEKVMPSRPGWRRHVPAALLLLAFVVLCVGAARPQVDHRVPRERATVMVAVDVSLSMEATDVDPSRLAAAQAAARQFVDGLPAGFNVGIVSFARTATVLDAPSPDRASADRAIDGLQLAEGTAIGDGVLSSLAQIKALSQQSDTTGSEPVPAEIVLLSDGTNTYGSSLNQAVAAAQKAGVPVSTIAYGTPDGTVTIQGQTISVPVDVQALGQLADQTGGTGYTAQSASQLDDVYRDIQSSIGYTVEPRDISPWFVAGGLLLAMLGAALSLLWFSRLP